jgi:hypothetical protein
VTEVYPRRREEDATAPFVLDRAAPPDEPILLGSPLRADTEPAPDAPRHDDDATHHDAGVHDDVTMHEALHGEERSSEPVGADPAALPLDRAGRRAGRRLVWALLLDAALLLTVTATAGLRMSRAGPGAPDVLFGGLALVLALPCLLSAWSFRGLGQGSAHDDAHRFAQGIAHLRSIFVLKATVLFATLGLGCFAFSLIASLLSLL